eukprot:CAMPEP_0171455464 /NCGR_PEP_ID=MMETSP0945-20130129/2349_1 /TAXON_ID=109269 /ORGANISM="Vaucheria litorea, Strain CCMP2940" /LENGTH=232 /DNA_ID=CAMNT_0011980711 /DNA_START=41 /DNA_END=739 /DNA_ORIENTATION=-
MDSESIEAVVSEVANKAIIDHAKETERKLDEQLTKLENMEEDDFEVLREKRKLKLMKQQIQTQEWRANGHGTYTELSDQAEFFSAVKKSKKMAVHFYRPTTARCTIVDAKMEKLCASHLETRFCRVNAEKAPYLVEKLSIVVMPTILLVKDCQTVHQIRGFDEMGGTDDFHEDTLAYVMSLYGCCTFEGEVPVDATKSSKSGVNSINMAFSSKGIKEGGKFGNNSDEDDDIE